MSEIMIDIPGNNEGGHLNGDVVDWRFFVDPIEGQLTEREINSTIAFCVLKEQDRLKNEAAEKDRADRINMFAEEEALPLFTEAIKGISYPMDRVILLAELIAVEQEAETGSTQFLQAAVSLLGDEHKVEYEYACYMKMVDPVALQIEALVHLGAQPGVGNKDELYTRAQALAMEDPGSKDYERRMATFVLTAFEYGTYDDEKIRGIFDFIGTVKSEDGLLKTQLLEGLLKMEIKDSDLRKTIDKSYRKASKKLGAPLSMQRARHLTIADAYVLHNAEAPEDSNMLERAEEYSTLVGPKTDNDHFDTAQDLGLWLLSRDREQPQK